MVNINTNLSSLLVQTNLSNSTNALNTAIERMTTGFKINHAKDNAANYSISTNLSSQLSSYGVAQDNVSMGLDMLTTAMDSLSLLSSHLSRIRDLTEQAANGTYGQQSLSAIQSEVTARLNECSRIVSTTEYNGVKLFGEGNSSSASGGEFIQEIDVLTEEEAIQQGYTVIKTADELQAMKDDLDGKYILMNDIDLSGYDWTPIGTFDFDTGDLSQAFTGEFNGNGYVVRNLTINKPTEDVAGLFGAVNGGTIENVGLENINVAGGATAGALAGVAQGKITNCFVNEASISGTYCVGGLVGEVGYSDITSCYADSGLVVRSGNRGDVCCGGLIGDYFVNAGGGKLENCFSSGSVNSTVDNSVCGGLVGAFFASGNTNAEVINCYTSSEVQTSGVDPISGAFMGGTSRVNVTVQSSGYYSSVNPGLAAVGRDVSTGSDFSGLTDGVTPPENLLSMFNPNAGNNTPSVNTSITFQAGIHSDEGSQITLDLGFTFDLSVNVSSSTAARNSLSAIDEVLENISAKQTEYGAAYNRLESALESIGVSIENLTSTRSTIRDADIAEESSEYIKMQILQQASATLLATANQTPAIALQLL